MAGIGAIAIALMAVVVTLGSPVGALAATTFNVNSTADAPDASAGNGSCATAGGVCTVRAALQEANALPGADRVVIPAGTYSLGSALQVSSTVDIDGPSGARETVLDGAPAVRVMNVNGGGSMRFSGITLTGGNGGMTTAGADITLDRVAIRNNLATSPGLVEGGAVFVSSGSLTISRSTLSANQANSTGADAIGGAVSLNSNATLTITNSTVANNRAEASTNAFGGGLSLRTMTTTTLRHVTLVGNVAEGNTEQGGNIYRAAASSALTIGDSIIANGSSASGPNCSTPPSITVIGRNLDSGTSCGFPAGHLNNTPAQLEPLADRGGPTDTVAPMTTSPVRDAALACEPDGTDQRGVPLPTGNACDIGATELAADLTTTLDASRPSVAPGGDITFVARITNAGPDVAPATVLDTTLPAGTELVLAAPSNGTCTGSRCEVGALAPEASATVTLVVRAPATGPFSTSAAASSAHPDPAPADNSATVTTTVDVPPDATPGDGTAPTLIVSGKARQKLDAAIEVGAGCDEACTVVVTGTLAVKSGKAKRGKTFKLNPLSAQLAAGGQTTLELKVSRKARRAAARALAGGGKVKASLTLTATDAAGNSAKAARKVKLSVKKGRKP